ncbi:MAG: translation initiation factor IF-3 [Candidatus Marinimicrobia bacterium CG08_land_8_20_14_0_20_45_22]|nr:MAG: translation initiation factor IF-3 [Candidatus Marinimicrobia bacterium CG08_land_8_20_14_0_20_45_22]
MEKDLKINNQIRSLSVRLIDSDGKQIGIVSSREALRIAEEKNLDLVEISPNADPPVCKIIDYGKYRYQLQMKERESKKKQHVIKIKEVRFRPHIGEHDLIMKVNAVKKFLGEGCKVKITLMFRGREMARKEIGAELVNKIVEQLSDIAVVGKAPASEGRTIITYLTSK